jgi:ribosome-associated heat shock protein Hsp15
MRPEAIACARALNPAGWRGALTTLAAPAQARADGPRAAASGLRAAGPSRMPVEALERLDALLRAEQKPGGVVLTEAAWRAWAGPRPRPPPCCGPWTTRPPSAPSRTADRLEAARRGQGRAEAGQGPAGLAVRGPGQADRAAAEAQEAAPPEAGAAPRRPLHERGGRRHCRADVWLWRARFFKTRSLAAKFVEEGRIRVTRSRRESRVDKPSRTEGWRRAGVRPRRPDSIAVRVLGCGERRGPATEARELYEAVEG